MPEQTIENSTSLIPPSGVSATSGASGVDVDPRQQRIGLMYGFAAYIAWGFVPAYFKLVKHVPPLQVLAHRVIWSAVILVVLIVLTRRTRELAATLKSPAIMLRLAATTMMISINWYLFIWMVANNHVVDASLGYFINPLAAVLLGVVFLGERLRRLQIASVAIAAIGVTTAVVIEGNAPWLSFGLAVSFAFYGLIRKTTGASPIVGLTTETLLLILPAAALIAFGPHYSKPWPAASWSTFGLLMLAGVVTALPLLWFAAGAKRLRLSTIGFLQYIAPTLQFLLAIFAFKEPFTRTRMWSFSAVWFALVIYSIDSILEFRRAGARQRALVTVPLEC